MEVDTEAKEGENKVDVPVDVEKFVTPPPIDATRDRHALFSFLSNS